ncbi:MAG: prolyl oligopeptidase family serine peptidase [Clostridia bacterium]|nr:prolyl oligopeptidase family serine peptidase [Clostridia bacterium]
MKKTICLLLCALLLTLSCGVAASAADPTAIPALKEKFIDGVGPEVDGLSVDYVSYAPEHPQGAKLPLVIFFHGAGQGAAPRAQIEENNFPLWASDEIQQRFTGGGAFLFVPRSHEENGEHWSDPYVESVKAAIDDFIAQHDGEIDLTRIYVGGFSMGGKMTLKMASSYPEFFAAAFPLCPAYTPSEDQIAALADLPIWLIVSRFDIIGGWYTFSQEIWQALCAQTRVPEDCRLTLFGRVKYPDGKNTPSNHHVWFALANDLFTYDEGAYPNAVTTDATGAELTLASPDGVVAWLCSHTSDYSGEPVAPNGTLADNPDNIYAMAGNVLRAVFPLVADAIGSFFSDLWAGFRGLFAR